MMRIRVEGKRPLNGSYKPSGSTNSAMAMLAAGLLSDQPVKLSNVPHTVNMQAMLAVAKELGATLDWHDEETVTIKTEQIGKRVLTQTDTNGLVGMMLFLPPMLMRRQHIRIEFDFPVNRIRTHLEALRDLGQDVSTTNGAIECRAVNWERKEIILTQTSVTATAIVMMLATRLGKETIIHNAACEPHVQELAYAFNVCAHFAQQIG